MLTQRSMTAHTRVVAPAHAMDEGTINIVAMPLCHVGGTSWALGSMNADGRMPIVREPVLTFLSAAGDDLAGCELAGAATQIQPGRY